jgi:hypothetical protein
MISFSGWRQLHSPAVLEEARPWADDAPLTVCFGGIGAPTLLVVGGGSSDRQIGGSWFGSSADGGRCGSSMEGTWAGVWSEPARPGRPSAEAPAALPCEGALRLRLLPEAFSRLAPSSSSCANMAFCAALLQYLQQWQAKLSCTIAASVATGLPPELVARVALDCSWSSSEQNSQSAPLPGGCSEFWACSLATICNPAVSLSQTLTTPSLLPIKTHPVAT